MEFAEFIKIPMVDKVTLVRPGLSRVVGTLCITGHHLLFSSRMQESEELMVSILVWAHGLKLDFSNVSFSTVVTTWQC